jgi:hypothetical protein
VAVQDTPLETRIVFGQLWPSVADAGAEVDDRHAVRSVGVDDVLPEDARAPVPYEVGAIMRHAGDQALASSEIAHSSSRSLRPAAFVHR